MQKKVEDIIGKVQLWGFLLTNVDLKNCDYTYNSVTMETAKIPHFLLLQLFCKYVPKYALWI